LVKLPELSSSMRVLEGGHDSVEVAAATCSAHIHHVIAGTRQVSCADVRARSKHRHRFLGEQGLEGRLQWHAGQCQLGDGPGLKRVDRVRGVRQRVHRQCHCDRDPEGGSQRCAPLQTYNASSNTDWIDLAADQTTLLYSDESSTRRRWDVGTNTALANFATCGASDFAKRIRPNGDVLVANGNGNGNVYRFDSAGTLQQTHATGIATVFAPNLDPDGMSFWTGATDGQAIKTIDIATGATLQGWNTATFGQGLYGRSVLGAVQAGGVASSLVEFPSRKPMR
jgi:hypothetical protein